MDNESVKEIQDPDRKMDIIMHDVTMTIQNTPKASVTNSINYMKNRNKKDKNSKYKNKLENKPQASNTGRWVSICGPPPSK